MGTRHLTCVVSDGEMKVSQYGQWDGYPEGQGKTVIEFIKNKLDKELLVKRVSKLKQVTNEKIDEYYVQCGAKPKAQFVDMIVSETFKKNFPGLCRDTGARILGMIQSGKVREIRLSTDFAHDSLFCEWAWVLDLDNDILEVYKGFNKKKLPKKARFYTDTKNEGGYYPIKLFKKYKFSDINIGETVEELTKLAKEKD